MPQLIELNGLTQDAANDRAAELAIDSVEPPDIVPEDGGKFTVRALLPDGMEVPGATVVNNTVPANRTDMATLIVSAFAAAGYGNVQQIAALANAIAESNLNPTARLTTANEDSVGLFQLNMRGGVGDGHSVAELEDPATNTNLIINECNKVQDFKTAASLQDAVAIFVKKVERPASPESQIVKRVAIAQKIVI